MTQTDVSDLDAIITNACNKLAGKSEVDKWRYVKRKLLEIAEIIVKTHDDKNFVIDQIRTIGKICSWYNDSSLDALEATEQIYEKASHTNESFLRNGKVYLSHLENYVKSLKKSKNFIKRDFQRYVRRSIIDASDPRPIYFRTGREIEFKDEFKVHTDSDIKFARTL